MKILGGYAINGSYFGSDDSPIVIQNINCNGTEDTVTQCPTISFTTSNCNDSTVAGIVCYGKRASGMVNVNFQINLMLLELIISQFYVVFQPDVNVSCNNGDVRLTDGLRETEGRLEICFDNHWGGVCGSSWDGNEANVVCRQLGHLPIGEKYTLYW